MDTSVDHLGLPQLFTFDDFDGSLSEYLEVLWTRYHALMHEPGIRLWGMPLRAIGKARGADRRDLTFWHLITAHAGGEKSECNRVLNLYRCANLPRVCAALALLALEDLRVCWWREPGDHVVMAPVDFSLVVRLQRRRGTYRVASAYPTYKPGKRRHQFERAQRRWARSDHPVMARRRSGLLCAAPRPETAGALS